MAPVDVTSSRQDNIAALNLAIERGQQQRAEEEAKRRNADVAAASADIMRRAARILAAPVHGDNQTRAVEVDAEDWAMVAADLGLDQEALAHAQDEAKALHAALYAGEWEKAPMESRRSLVERYASIVERARTQERRYRP